MSLPYASVVAGFDFDDDGQKKHWRNLHARVIISAFDALGLLKLYPRIP